jgi:serine/threonine-protein kinase RsbW
MTNEYVTASAVGFSGKIVKLTLKGSERSSNFLSELLWTFESCLNQDIIYFIIDLRFLKELPSSIIVLLVEMTNRARRKGGDVFLVNIGRMARNNLLTFNPSSYLASAGDEESAVDECEDRIQYQKSDYYPRQPFFHTARPPTHIDLKRDSMEIPSRVESLYKVCNFAVDFARSMRFSDAELNKIKIAVYEACLNVIEHAYHSDPTQVVRVDVEQTTDRLIITVIDHGSGFQADERDFDVMEAAMHRRTGGMGLHIIRRSMDEVNYKMDPIMGNRLVMVKYLSSAFRQEDFEYRTNIKIR